ncbi:MAG: hypothetical protein HDT21_10505 [Ruminococcus sp.]|nr:hypothetical protein [Ruminococcus sp.]
MFAPPRNAVAFLTSCSVLNDMRLRAREGYFALCGARPKGSALWKLAALKGWRTFCIKGLFILLRFRFLSLKLLLLTGKELLYEMFKGSHASLRCH